MWKDYSASFIKNNRASSMSIMVAALIATLFLSLLCSLSFNFWRYEVEQIVLEEGNWQGRIIGEIDDDDLAVIQNFANVENVVVNEKLSGKQGTAIDVYFHNVRTIFQDMPLIVERLGLEEDTATYHLLLLSRYLIHDPLDEEPPLLMTFYLVMLVIVSLSLILIIRNSFAVSMNARIHQFGIFSSIGATPGQIRTCLMQEAAVLCLVPILFGSLLGIALSFGAIQGINVIAADVAGRHEAVFQYHSLIFAITIMSSVLTVLFSAWLPARKLSRMTPLEAIRNTGELQLKKKKHSLILSFLFGIEGELAGNSLKARKKALRTTTLSLTLAFFAFTAFLCFATLSSISVKYTYFERYKDSWDVMATIKDTAIADFESLDNISGLENVDSCVIYQKATGYTTITSSQQSDELIELGGISTVAGEAVQKDEENYLVKMPIVVLDDKGFAAYCRQLGMEPQVDGGILINRIWDSINSNFRYAEYVPFLKETEDAVTLKDGKGEALAEISVIGYVTDAPVLREEYDDYALVCVLPLSIWNTISENADIAETDTFLRILAFDDTRLNEDMTVIQEMLESRYKIEIENRVQEEISNTEMRDGYMLIIGALCALLAVIGIANIFCNTLGFIYQRKREFARYLSIGVTPEGIRKILRIEALSIAGRPLLITLPVTVLFVIFAVTASYLNLMEFIVQMPLLPVALFILLIFFFVGLAYYIGGKKLFGYNLSEALKDDTMV